MTAGLTSVHDVVLVGALVLDTHGSHFADELEGRDYVLGEMWKNTPPFSLNLHESGAALVLDIGVLVWKIEESIEAGYLASLKTAQNPDGGPYPASAYDKSWDETSGKTGSGKKFFHSVISENDSAAQTSDVATVTSVKTLHGGLEIDENPAGMGSDSKPVPGTICSKRSCWTCTRRQQIGWQLSSGSRGLRPRNRRSMWQVRVGRQREGHFSRHLPVE